MKVFQNWQKILFLCLKYVSVLQLIFYFKGKNFFFDCTLPLNSNSSEPGSLNLLTKSVLHAAYVAGLFTTIKSSASPRIFDLINANNAQFIAFSAVATFSTNLSQVCIKCDRSLVPSSYMGIASRNIVNLNLNCSNVTSVDFLHYLLLRCLPFCLIFDYALRKINCTYKDKVRWDIRNFKDLYSITE